MVSRRSSTVVAELAQQRHSCRVMDAQLLSGPLSPSPVALVSLFAYLSRRIRKLGLSLLAPSLGYTFIFLRQLKVLAPHLNKTFSRLLITTGLRNNVRRTGETCHCFRGTGILRFGLLHTRRAAFLSTKLHWNVFPDLDIVLYDMGFLESRTVS